MRTSLLIRSMKDKLKSISLLLESFFLTMFIAGIVLISALIILGLYSYASNAHIVQANINPPSLLPFFVFLSSIMASLLLLKQIFGSIAHANSPFTASNIRRLIALGVLFLVKSLASLLGSSSFYCMVTIGAFTLEYHSIDAIASFPLSAIFIAIRGIIGSIICFSLSFICQYGTLLQVESDNLF